MHIISISCLVSKEIDSPFSSTRTDQHSQYQFIKLVRVVVYTAIFSQYFMKAVHSYDLKMSIIPAVSLSCCLFTMYVCYSCRDDVSDAHDEDTHSRSPSVLLAGSPLPSNQLSPRHPSTAHPFLSVSKHNSLYFVRQLS